MARFCRHKRTGEPGVKSSACWLPFKVAVFILDRQHVWKQPNRSNCPRDQTDEAQTVGVGNLSGSKDSLQPERYTDRHSFSYSLAYISCAFL